MKSLFSTMYDMHYNITITILCNPHINDYHFDWSKFCQRQYYCYVFVVIYLRFGFISFFCVVAYKNNFTHDYRVNILHLNQCKIESQAFFSISEVRICWALSFFTIIFKVIYNVCPMCPVLYEKHMWLPSIRSYKQLYLQFSVASSIITKSVYFMHYLTLKIVTFYINFFDASKEFTNQI